MEKIVNVKFFGNFRKKSPKWPTKAQWAKGMWSVNLRCPNFELKALLNSFLTLFGAYLCKYLLLKSFILLKDLILAMSKFGIFDKILEKYSICYAKFGFLNNPPQILNMCL